MQWKVPALESETGTAPSPSGRGAPHPLFTQKAFIQHRLNFIVADDQVGKAHFECLVLV